jgi:hypothetical protein
MYNHGLNLRLNRMPKGYVSDITPSFSNMFHELVCCSIAVMKILSYEKYVATEFIWL